MCYCLLLKEEMFMQPVVSYATQFQESGQREWFQKTYGISGLAIIDNVFKYITPGATLELGACALHLCYSQVNERDRCLQEISLLAPPNTDWLLVAKKGNEKSVILTLTASLHPTQLNDKEKAFVNRMIRENEKFK